MLASPSSAALAELAPARERLPGLLLVVLAVAIVAGSGWLVYDDFRPSYGLSADEVGSAPADAEVVAVGDLPPDARAAFEKARDGGYVAHAEPSWHDTFPVYEAVYVRADGTVYRTWARSQGLRGASLFVAVPATLLALVLGVVGARSYRRGSVRPPLTALAVLGAGLAVSFGWPFHGTLIVVGVGVGPAKVSVLAMLAAGVGTWVGLDRYEPA